MAELPIIISDPARDELDRLWDAYACISEDLADRLVIRIGRAISRLGSFPEIGRLRPEFNLAGLRSFAVRPHVIFYSVSDAPSVIIHHVVDGRRNLAAFLLNERI